MIGLAVSQQTIIVAALVALAIVVLFFFILRAGRRKPPKAAPEELPPAKTPEKLELPKIEVPAVPAPATRLVREQKAREELEALEESLRAAREALSKDPQSAAAQAEAKRYERDATDARRKLDYEQRKTTEAQEKAQRAAEAAAREEAEAKLRAEEAERAEEQKRAEMEARRKAAQAESGRTLAEGLAKTRGGFMARLNALLGTGKDLDEAALGELEEILFSADVGVRTATALLESVRERLKRKELSDLSKVKAALREEIERILSQTSGAHGGLPELASGVAPPQVVMVVGVNGVGKTTTIGKLAAKLKQSGKSVIMGAGDTFRAAAGEQLDVWAERAQVPIVRGKDQSDPGAVLFDAVARGKNDKLDVVLCDTAGRLHTKTNLMEELVRVKRTLSRAHAGAPQEVLLVVDATNGQNAIQQAKMFHESLGVTGFVLTKLDGTAKGGVIIGICDELKIPVRYIGVGEKVADLKPFDPHEFVAALFAE
ncbi:MAG TPA: signal recognition particle-docking protein FtsY [Myxococcales bacterium]|nr:signal recognition particle-docking protein FtsY [Myxococcales bacterium]